MFSKSIAHIINPVVVGETSDLHAAQPVTFESMRLAKNFAKRTVAVELYSAQAPEDGELVPSWIARTEDLKRCILDVGNFQHPRRLPLIKDILDSLYASSTADYFIYTNVDIALVPHFYIAVAQLLGTGLDALVINRRTISKAPSDPEHLPLMWAQAGEKHPGYDCFVFRRDAYPHFNLGTACIGANWIGRVLLSNVHAHADNFRVFEDYHLTFHLGDDRSWKIPQFSDYDRHNENELLKILRTFKQQGKLDERPLLDKFLQDILRSQAMTKTTLSQNPIFVVGYPRSGTTLLQALLATQGNIATFPETHFFSTLYGPKITIEDGETLSHDDTTTVLGEISKRGGLEFSPAEIETLQALGSRGRIPSKAIFEFLVASLLPSDAGPGCRWLEKTPDHAFFMEEIGTLYPEAKFIGIVRHPLYAIHSRTKYFPPDVQDKLGFLASQWVKHVEALEKFKMAFPEKIFVLKYEDLAQNPAGVIQKITRFLGIDFDIHNIQDFSKRAEDIIQPFENWKDGLKSNRIENKNGSVQNLFGTSEILKIQSIVHQKMGKYGYRINYPLQQFFYNIFSK